MDYSDSVEESDVTALEKTFTLAADHIPTIAANVDSNNLLYLYARYKQSTVGACNVSKPGFFDFQGKQKWEAWKSMADKSKSEAMQEYIDKVRELDPHWSNSVYEDSTSSATPRTKYSQSAFGPVVSTLMMDSDAVLTDEEKTIFDWVKDGNLSKLQSCEAQSLDGRDEQGMTLLHWACDRGHVDIAKWLLSSGASIDLQDEDGQTALHYASSCNYPEIIELLMQRNSDATIVDLDGATPLQVAANDHIVQLLS